MSNAPRVTASADAILAKINLLKNPYFTSLADNSMSQETFRHTQEQFFFAVQYYARPIAALVARLPDPTSRVDLVHNLVEEHGDFHPDQFHPTTFRKFLTTIHARDPLTANVPIASPVQAFNCTLMGACATADIELGICCLGIIEQAFAGVSKFIGSTIVHRGWLPADKLIHYDLHAELDVRHAEDFFAIVEPRYDNPQSRAMIDQGLNLGTHAFDQLYRNLLTTTDE